MCCLTMTVRASYFRPPAETGHFQYLPSRRSIETQPHKLSVINFPIVTTLLLLVISVIDFGGEKKINFIGSTRSYSDGH